MVMAVSVSMDFSHCFFCGAEIGEKVSREHIFGNAFLGYLDLKLEALNSSFKRATTYSRIKVPAHPSCNNQQGSQFEREILNLVRTMDDNLAEMEQLRAPTPESLGEALREIFTLWIAKLYYGLLYWEAGLERHDDPEYQRWLRGLLHTQEFAYLRKCLVEGSAFRLPSSLFYFYLSEPPEPALRFDFATGLPLGLVYIRFRRHLLVAALGDGNLVGEYFTQQQVERGQAHISNASSEEALSFLHAIAHIWAVREWLPVEPRIEYGVAGLVDRSRDGYTTRPLIDGAAVSERARELFEEHRARWRRGSRPAPG